MKETITYEFTNCEDCPHSGNDKGHGYSALRCGHKKWEAGTSRDTIPWDCPLTEENKNKTSEDIEKEYEAKDQERKEKWVKPFRDDFKKIGAELIDYFINTNPPVSIEFFINNGEPNKIADVIRKHLPIAMATNGTEKGYSNACKYKFSRA